jgi:enoyl-CoA hydratase
MGDPVTYQRTEAIAVVRMDDGKVNALSPRMLAELNRALDRALEEQATVLLTGREGVFSAGFDLKVLRAGGADAAAMLEAGFKLSERLLSFPLPVVIACGGHALAMGCFLLLSTDYRIGAQGAFRIGANEVAIGMTIPGFGVEISRQRLAPVHCHRALVNAEIYAPDGAVEAGFLDRAVPAAELMEEAQRVAAGLSALNMPAHAATKLAVRAQALEALRRAVEADKASWRP